MNWSHEHTARSSAPFRVEEASGVNWSDEHTARSSAAFQVLEGLGVNWSRLASRWWP
jgi:arabinogalactan endo-1,4-beta-galactosidase